MAVNDNNDDDDDECNHNDAMNSEQSLI